MPSRTSLAPDAPGRSPAGQPRYSLVARALAEHIGSGRYAVGELLPTEAELCRQFGVSRTTLREATRWLRDRGMVSARAGVGTMVLASQQSSTYVHAVDSISDVFQYTKDSRNPVVLSSDDIDVDGPIARLLRCPDGQRWLRIELTRAFVDDEVPILCSTVYVPQAYAGIAKWVPTRSAPIYASIESEYGEAVLGVEQEFKSMRLDARRARILKARAGSPALCVTRHYFGTGDRLLLVTVSVYRADRYSYRMRLRFNPQPGKEV